MVLRFVCLHFGLGLGSLALVAARNFETGGWFFENKKEEIGGENPMEGKSRQGCMGGPLKKKE